MIRERNWPRPQLNPLPHSTANCEKPLCSLNGDDWLFISDAPRDFFIAEPDLSSWSAARVPYQMECGEQEYAYTRIISVPAAWHGLRVFIRFDGANCLARVFVDGQPVRYHYGGFVSWDCELTDFVSPGKTHRLTIGIQNRNREICSFHRGGLIRDVSMYALPRTYLSRLHADTTFDEKYLNANLTLGVAAAGDSAADVSLALVSTDGTRNELGALRLAQGESRDFSCLVEHPQKWDSEHPILYTIEAKLRGSDGSEETVSKPIGFRQIEIRGETMLVNGDIVKLRGVNRHDTHPLSGFALSREQLEQDLRLLREANINFIRTSHYPPQSTFLDLCDKYGMYVEDEIAVAFLGYGCESVENDPEKLPLFMNQFSELIERDRSHPCVIIWSLANESHWGDNLQAMYDYARFEDPSRPTIFSFPFTQADDVPATEIWSVHYGKYNSDMGAMQDSQGRSEPFCSRRPVLHDESTHIPCYDLTELRRDPGIRDFWGETIVRFWNNIWNTRGALGCAIWAGIDNTRVKDGRISGSEWGIIDGWRRKKPEYWHVRKAFSPVYIQSKPKRIERGLTLEVENRFNHTNLNEVFVRWQTADAFGESQGPNIAPREKGTIELSVCPKNDERILITFTGRDGVIVQEAAFTLEETQPCLPSLNSAPSLTETEDEWSVSGERFDMHFSRRTGLIEKGMAAGKQVLTGGPALQLTGFDLGPWTCESSRAEVMTDCVRITTSGFYDDVGVTFEISIDALGLIKTDYNITAMPYDSPRKTAISSSITSHSGGYSEVGVYYTVSKECTRLKWLRKGLWSVYPDWHIARTEGTAEFHNNEGINAPDRSEKWDWKQDELDWAGMGRYYIASQGTNDFRSMKPDIISAEISGSDGRAFTALSDGNSAVRIEKMIRKENTHSADEPAICYQGAWTLTRNRNHTLGGIQAVSRNKGDYCEYCFNGTGIAWIASMDKIGGLAKVTIDGKSETIIDLGIAHEKNPRGYLRTFGQTVFAVHDLKQGEHKLRIEVMGETNAECVSGYVNIDSLIVLDGNEGGDIRFIINNEWNYPLISWANYDKPPIIVNEGYSGSVYARI